MCTTLLSRLTSANAVVDTLAPTLEDITPVLHSSQLSGALIILASHELLSVPTSVCAATCLIRLNTPVTNGRNDSLRFAAILQCAEHISRVWRKNGGSGAREIKEPETGLSPSSVPANLFLAPGPDSMSSPARLSIISSVSFFASSTPLPPPDPSQRAFDAILNFIPDGMNDLAVMKQSILVTSLSRPYLTPAYLASSPSHKSTIAPSRRSIFRRKSALPLSTISPADSFQSVPTPLPKSHILHILPGAGNVYLSQENLLRSMESFQLSFAYPPSLSMKRPGTLPHAVAFIVPVAALREVVRYTPPSQMASHTSSLCSHDPSASSTASSSSHVARQAIATEWTVVDILLSGVLDVQANPGSVPHAGPRAWIGGAADVSFTFDIESESASRSESVSSLSCSNEPLTPTSDFPGHGLELEQVGRDGLYDGAQVYPAEDIMDENAMEKDGVVLHETVLKHPLLEVPIKLPLTFGPDYPLSPSSSDDSELGAVQLTGQEIVEVLRSH